MELARYPEHEARGRGGHHRARGHGEVRAVVAVVGVAPAAEIPHLGDPHAPALLDRSLRVVEEVGDRYPPVGATAPEEEPDGEPRPQHLDAGKAEARWRRVGIALQHEQGLAHPEPPGGEAEDLGYAQGLVHGSPPKSSRGQFVPGTVTWPGGEAPSTARSRGGHGWSGRGCARLPGWSTAPPGPRVGSRSSAPRPSLHRPGGCPDRADLP